jgi:hypothetical protein
VKRIVPVLLLVVIIGAMVAACGKSGVGSSTEPIMTIYTDGTKGCKQEVYPVLLWNRAGAGAARGESIGEIPHSTQLDVYEVKEYFGVDYYQVVYEGQRGWVAGIFVSEAEPSCP